MDKNTKYKQTFGSIPYGFFFFINAQHTTIFIIKYEILLLVDLYDAI